MRLNLPAKPAQIAEAEKPAQCEETPSREDIGNGEAEQSGKLVKRGARRRRL
jgi:hypothetical protein